MYFGGESSQTEGYLSRILWLAKHSSNFTSLYLLANVFLYDIIFFIYFQMYLGDFTMYISFLPNITI